MRRQIRPKKNLSSRNEATDYVPYTLIRDSELVFISTYEYVRFNYLVHHDCCGCYWHSSVLDGDDHHRISG